MAPRCKNILLSQKKSSGIKRLWAVHGGDCTMESAPMVLFCCILLRQYLLSPLLTVYNTLPLDIRISVSTCCFRRQLKAYYKLVFRPP